MDAAAASTVTLRDVQQARERIRNGIYESPCVESIPLSEIAGANIHCKLDFLQRTGSFKERGARNTLMQLSQESKARGVIAASAGNHALGLAYHGGMLDVPVTVVMPRFAPLIKVVTCRKLGAHVVLHGDSFDEARAHALELARQQEREFISPYDHAHIIAGQGTMGLEIIEQWPQVEAIVVPVGGGGLIAGLATAVKTLKPKVKIIGVESEHAASFCAARAAGTPTRVDTRPSLADGLNVAQTGGLAFAIANDLVDDVVLVDEAYIALAILRLIELEKSVVEGSGAASLAAFLAGKLRALKGKNVVLCLCGGNIDLSVLDRVIELGLVADYRLTRFIVEISDRPGGMAHLAGLIASTGASIKEIVHDRAFSGPDLSAVRVICTVETQDKEHISRLHDALRDAGIKVTEDTSSQFREHLSRTAP